VFFRRNVLGKTILVQVGTFIKLGVGLGVSLANTKNECVDQSCWAGEAKLTGSVALIAKGEVNNPAITELCEREDEFGDEVFVPCALILVQGTGVTGISGSGFADCVKVGLAVTHEGFKIELKFILLEGTFISFSVGTEWEILPPIKFYEGFVALPQ